MDMNIVGSATWGHGTGAGAGDGGRVSVDIEGGNFSCDLVCKFNNSLDVVDIVVVGAKIQRRDYNVFINAVISYDCGDGEIKTSWGKWYMNMNKLCKSGSTELDIFTTHGPYHVTGYTGSIHIIGPPVGGSPVEGPPVANPVPPLVGEINTALSDVTFMCGGGAPSPVNGCRALLSTISPVFRAMFCNGSFTNESVIQLPDVTHAAMTKLVEFSTTRTYTPHVDDSEFITLSQKYLVGGVVDVWVRLAVKSITVDNVVQLLITSRELDSTTLIKACIVTIKRDPSKVEGLSTLDSGELISIITHK